MIDKRWVVGSNVVVFQDVAELIRGVEHLTTRRHRAVLNWAALRVLVRKLLEEKRRLPDRINELLPADVQESEHLVNICRRLIHPDPRKRFANAEEALEGTYQFLQDLARVRLAVHYSQEIKRWLTDVKKALP